MQESIYQISQLITRQLKEEISETEQQELDAWLIEFPQYRILAERLGEGNELDKELLSISTVNMDAARDALVNRLFSNGRLDTKVDTSHILKRAWLRYAAILLLVAGTATYLYKTSQKIPETIVHQPSNQPDVRPGGNKAILTLADGSNIVLDSVANGHLASQGNTQIFKVGEGSLSYQGGASNGKVTYNSISTPKGGQYQVTLPDGSKVWLNAESSIRFPTVFANDRNVHITGEVYFEIATVASHPFQVTASNIQVQVLGTYFNINAYENEASIRTTLINGSIKVIKGNESVVVKPGQQVQSNDHLVVLDDINTEQAVAWKEGVFSFHHLTLQEVMRQIERWYDVKVVYEAELPEVRFGGKMGRNVQLSRVLNFLKDSGIHFRIEENGKQIVITK